MQSYENELELFKLKVNKAEKDIKGPDIFKRQEDNTVDEIRIMRRWNSHTPSITNVMGGGYYLHWKKKGTIIDPGYSFMKLFRQLTNYNVNNIDMIVVTHDHTDHCQDLAALITLFRQFNKWAVDEGINEFPRTWDMLTSYGVADQYNSLLTNPDNSPFIFWQRIFVDQQFEIKNIGNIPSFLINAQSNKLLKKGSYQDIYLKEINNSFIQKYNYRLETLPANHKELFGNTTSFGLKIALKENIGGNNLPVIVISGDTGINQNSDKNDGELLSKCYEDADLLILHVGSIEKPGEKRYNGGGHLGLQGIVEILKNIYISNKHKPKLVVLTEWGYEFGSLGLNGRSRFTWFVEQELKKENCNDYYAAVQMSDASKSTCFPEQGIPIIPADISLRIQLPSLEIFADNDWCESGMVYAKESLEKIDYYKL